MLDQASEIIGDCWRDLEYVMVFSISFESPIFTGRVGECWKESENYDILSVLKKDSYMPCAAMATNNKSYVV